MRRKHLKAEQVADLAGLHLATVYRLKKGEIANPSLDTVVALEDALGLRRGTLVFGPPLEARAS